MVLAILLVGELVHVGAVAVVAVAHVRTLGRGRAEVKAVELAAK
jgi:hypothetical protein